MSDRGRGRGRGSYDVRNNTSTTRGPVNSIYADLETLTPEVMATGDMRFISKFVKLLEKYEYTKPRTERMPTQPRLERMPTQPRLERTQSLQHYERTRPPNPRVKQYENIKNLVVKLGAVWTHKLGDEYMKEYGVELDTNDMPMSALVRSTRGIHAVQSQKDTSKYFAVPNGPLVDEPDLDDGDDNANDDAIDDANDDDYGWDDTEVVLTEVAEAAEATATAEATEAADATEVAEVVTQAPDPE